MTKIICLCGGPGVGKSTVATGLFSALKQRKVSCEYVSEYAKEIVWEGTHKLLENQIHIFAEQFRRQFRLLGKVDYIITDSPLCLSSVYLQDYLWKMGYEGAVSDFFRKPFNNKSDVNSGMMGITFSVASTPTNYIDMMVKFMDQTFQQFDNMVYMIKRVKAYDPNGRNQDLKEAEALDLKIQNKLWMLGALPTEIKGSDEENIQFIINDIFEKVELPKLKQEMFDEYKDTLRDRWAEGEHIKVKLTPEIQKEDI